MEAYRMCVWCVCVCVYRKKESEVAQLCPTLCYHMDCSLPGSSNHGILQARILRWVAISFSRGYSQPRDRTRVSRIGGRCFNLWAHSCHFLQSIILGMISDVLMHDCFIITYITDCTSVHLHQTVSSTWIEPVSVRLTSAFPGLAGKRCSIESVNWLDLLKLVLFL